MATILKIGTWDKDGKPIGWHLDGMSFNEIDYPHLYLRKNGDVYIHAVLMKEWSDERKKAMAIKVER